MPRPEGRENPSPLGDYGMHTSRFGYETICSDAGGGCGESTHLRNPSRVARRACDSVLDTSNRFGVSPCRWKFCRWAVSRIAVSTKRGGAARSHCRAPNHLPAAARRGRPGAGDGCDNAPRPAESRKEYLTSRTSHTFVTMPHLTIVSQPTAQ